MGQAVRGRTFPFHEHMTLADRQEYDWLAGRYARRERLQTFEKQPLNVLAARIVLPDEPVPPEPA